MESKTSCNPVQLLRISVRVKGWDKYTWGYHRHREWRHRCATLSSK